LIPAPTAAPAAAAAALFACLPPSRMSAKVGGLAAVCRTPLRHRIAHWQDLGKN
jgi:hypothetical protein